MTTALRALLAISLAAFAWHLLFIGDERHFLAAMGNLALIGLLIIPVMMGVKVNIFDPFAFFTAYVAIGTTATAYLIAFGNSYRRDVVMDGRQIEFFMPAGISLSIAMILVGMGFAFCSQRIDLRRFLPQDDLIDTAAFRFVSVVTVIISIIAIIAFIDSTGGLSLDEISKKRALELEQDGEIVYGNAGYVRLAAGLASSILLITLARYLQSPYRLRLSAKLMIGVLLFISLIVPFVASSRATVGYTLISLLFVYSVHRKISVRFFTIIFTVIMIFFSAMTVLRTAGQVGRTDVQYNPLIALAESGNGLSISGTAHIIAGVPSRMDYKLGKTYLTWITAPIPRSLWPGKPEVSLGKEIKETILGETVYKGGRPPSIFSEGYINFGWVGFLMIAFPFGYLMRLLTRSFNHYLTYSVFSIAIYFPLITNFTSSVNASVSQIIVRILADLIAVYGIYFAMRLFSKRRQTRSQSNAHQAMSRMAYRTLPR